MVGSKAAPGGEFVIGCQNEDPAALRFDSKRRPDEVMNVVRLDPFLMAAHELTQAQWERMWTFDEAGKRPSRYGAGQPNYQAGVIARNHPVECFELPKAIEMLDGYGLRIPTEAQWEYACRAGTAGPYAGDLNAMGWWTGNSGDAVVEVAQVVDRAGHDLEVVDARIGAVGRNRHGREDKPSEGRLRGRPSTQVVEEVMGTGARSPTSSAIAGTLVVPAVLSPTRADDVRRR